MRASTHRRLTAASASIVVWTLATSGTNTTTLTFWSFDRTGASEDLSAIPPPYALFSPRPQKYPVTIAAPLNGDYQGDMPAPKTAKNQASEFAPLADELGALEKEMAPYAQKLSRIDLLRKQLRAACPVAADKEWTVEGARFAVVLGACADQRHIDIKHLVRLISAKSYAIFATCTLKALEENTSPGVVAAVVTSSASGPRSLKTFERAGA
jgi:hypothetical protein